MKHFMLLSIIVCSVLFSSAQRVIKEKTETKVDGPYITKKTKIEYKKAPRATTTTVVGTSSTAHKAYGSRRAYRPFRSHVARAHYETRRATVRKHVAHRHHFMAFREYKRVTKHGKTKIKYKR